MGVTKLWDLLAPCGRRCSVDALARKRLAVDASIWLIQFIKAMRDDSGEMIQNAPLLGLFRRLCKLLFLHVHPVLVFDGATPVIKQRTVARRAAFRERQESSAKRTAEKILLNQLKGKHLLHGVAGAALPTAASSTLPAAAASESAAAAASLRDQFGEEETESLGLAGVESDDERAESDDCEWEGSTCEELRAWQAQPLGAGAGACGDAGASGAGSSLPDDVTHMRASAASGTAASDASADEPDRLLVPHPALLDEKAMRHLPASMQFELLDEIKVSERNRLRDQLVRREARGDLTAESFSHAQLSNYIEVSKVAGKVRARPGGLRGRGPGGPRSFRGRQLWGPSGAGLSARPVRR